MPKDPRLYAKDGKGFDAAVVILVVGNDEHEVAVHETLLCAASPFFASALKKDWEEGQAHRVFLPEDEPSVIALYIQWLYAGSIFSRPVLEKEEDSNDAELNLLIDSFIFGEKIQDGNFKDAAIDALILSARTPKKNGTCWHPIGAAVDRAYKGTPKDSPLRMLFVQMHIRYGHSGWIKDEQENNLEFLADLARQFFDNRTTSVQSVSIDATLSSCQYHHHSEDETCYSAK